MLTTPRLAGSPSPPTTTGRPRNSGCRSTSTAAMNWSRSTCSTQCVPAVPGWLLFLLVLYRLVLHAAALPDNNTTPA